MKNTRIVAVLYAFIAALFYAFSTPFSKILLREVPEVMMASFLYLGAGVGVGIMYSFYWRKEEKGMRLEKKDLPYVIGMVVLDILAPIFLLFGIKNGPASSASLLGNFEIVATSLIALLFFKEKVSGKLWTAIGLITLSSFILSFEKGESFSFTPSSILVLLATLSWGLENNYTRSISNKSSYEIVTIKGIFSGLGSLVIALACGERIPEVKFILMAVALGFVSYGLSIFTYVRAQNVLGAAKTSAYYAVAPFVGSFLGFLLVGEKLTLKYAISLPFMIAGTLFVLSDTLIVKHRHLHTHTITHTHDGYTHTHVLEHDHSHLHLGDTGEHAHSLSFFMDSREHKAQHMVQ